MSRVLVVDNEQNLRLVYRQVLSNGGYEVLEAESEIVGLFVIPDYTKSGLSQFASEDAVDARNLIVCFPGNIVMDK
jgi:CheY-like chemotaxis protein